MANIARQILSTFDQLERHTLDLHTLFEFVGGNVPARSRSCPGCRTDSRQARFLEGGRRQRFLPANRGRPPSARRSAATSPCTCAKAAISAKKPKPNMAPILAECGANLHEVDIDDDPVLLARYTNDVPVIFVGSQFFAQHRVDVARLRRQLESAKN